MQFLAFFAVSSILFWGTTYSIVFDTYLDTSNPRLAHLHQSSGSTHFWADKRSLLNVYFIKQAWGWTSAAFLLACCTGHDHTRVLQSFRRWFTASAAWTLLTRWCFGPSIFDRIILSTGGECVLPSLSASKDLTIFSVPLHFCLTRTSISPDSHPYIFRGSSFHAYDGQGGKPRLSRGHDVSGHTFLLSLSVLLLAEQIRPHFGLPHWSKAQALAVCSNMALILVWLFAIGTTSVYFHTPEEKISGYVLGVASFGLSQIS
ncbi:Fat storage-inducing transmembrane protein [Favolaschia claudopus]|uniref:Fat storage-inducing transmembrane protein n=1 Tax=Favolaschia claudopus TaxID=2862362 RepID=A0AAW0ALY1_9AGAR